MKNILLCIDAEEGTKKAIDYAIEITGAFNGWLTVLHVITPYLKKFADEIYAVGRIEYINHIDKELRKEAEDIINGFKAMADSTGSRFTFIKSILSILRRHMTPSITIPTYIISPE
jgi:nucleotide-binding universal stress UspA family protein